MSTNIDRAAEVIGAVMSRWDMAGRPDMAEGIDRHLAVALAVAGLLAPELPPSPWRAWERHTDLTLLLSGNEVRLTDPEDGNFYGLTADQSRALAHELLAAAARADYYDGKGRE